jgi:hypothetical protein
LPAVSTERFEEHATMATRKRAKAAEPRRFGNDVGRGMTGGGKGGDVSASMGTGRTSWGDDDAGTDLALEGASRRGLDTQDGRERSADYPRRPFPSEGSSSPTDLGMGAGDPGYTAEEDDRGTGKLPRKV